MPEGGEHLTRREPIARLRLIAAAAVVDALIRMRAALDIWEMETNDLGRWPEPDEVVAHFEKEMHDWFGTPKWYDQ